MKPHTFIAALASCGFGPPEAQTPTDATTDAAEPYRETTGPRWEPLDADASRAPGSDASSTSAHDTSHVDDVDTSHAGEDDTSTGAPPSSSTSVGSSDSSSEGGPSSTTADPIGSSTGDDPCACCEASSDPGCELPEVEACVCAWDDGVTSAAFCCDPQGVWGVFCIDVAVDHCGLDCTAC